MKNAQSTLLTTASSRVVNLEHKFLNDDFCEDAKAYWKNKHGWKHNSPLNSFFTAEAIKEFIVDKDIDPVYEDDDSYQSKYNGYQIETHAEKVFKK